MAALKRLIDTYTTWDDLTKSGTVYKTDHDNVYVHGDHADLRAYRPAWRVIARTSDQEYVVTTGAFRSWYAALDHVMLISTIL